MSKRIKDYYNTHPEYRTAISPSGRKHTEGRKGVPLSEFGKLFYAHYGFISRYNPALYRKELRYWSQYHIASWELCERMDEYNT